MRSDDLEREWVVDEVDHAIDDAAIVGDGACAIPVQTACPQAAACRSAAASTLFTPTWLIDTPAAGILSAMRRSARH